MRTPSCKGYTNGATRFNSAYGFNFLHAERITPSLVQRALTAWPETGDSGGRVGPSPITMRRVRHRAGRRRTIAPRWRA